MRLILTGCEYSGGTTMARAIGDWILREFSSVGVRIHDHWVYPYIADQDPSNCFVLGHEGVIREGNRYGYLGKDYESTGMSEALAADVRALKPWMIEQLQRAMVWRHLHPSNIAEEFDSIQVGFHYAEAVYAPLYYGYGEPGSFADRRRRAREWDKALVEVAPETVLVLLTASTEVICERMRVSLRPDHIPREDDVEMVVRLFQDQYDESELSRKLEIHSSGVTVEESVAEFSRKIEPFITQKDRHRRG